ncbi:hypothetical protein LHV18_12470 [Providencia rettgeri]|uniref:hypothetical protein n=1 Tax=Providencia rettgeri TaxID=587 RepID=UPI001CFDE079|nr:hypothetical protein [Providencia rettgeri]EIU7557592.1 hypothetical protein [Providencia rettgeri]MCB4841441.1 hypothetical protein [Providencia rettgeri]
MKDYSVTHDRFNFKDIKCSLHVLNEHCQSSNSLIAVIDGDTQQVVMIECHPVETNVVSMKNRIPPMTNPLGKHWAQPNHENILIDDTHVIMSSKDFNSLAEYSNSIPSGVYAGKMWKAVAQDGRAFLRWFGLVEGRNDLCSNNQREIIIID